MWYLYWENVWLKLIMLMHNFEETNTTCMYLRPKLMGLDYVREYPAGKKIPHVDVLSRHTTVVYLSRQDAL
jgi:hypothetical protein